MLLPRRDPLEHLLERVSALQASELWDSARLGELQARLSAHLLAHARVRIPEYGLRLRGIADVVQPGSAEWRRIPLLTRQQLLREPARFRVPGGARHYPGVFKVSTSGSTGEPVQVLRTAACRETWEASVLRQHRWHRRDATRCMAIIRAGAPAAPPPEGRLIPRGMPFEWLWQCGPTWTLDMTADLREQAVWLTRVQPHYLLTYPANLAGVLPHLERGAIEVAQVIGVGGAVSKALKTLCRDVLGCDVVANYSSQELGIMALQCAHCGQYHVQSEHVLLEVLDEVGDPCGPGMTGRVVATDLHNYLMPLIRYDIGDYAVVGDPCPGGIGLPSIREFVGRRRNMLVHDDGRRHWPLTGFAGFRAAAPVLRYQVVQHDLHDIELRVAVESPLTTGQFDALSRTLAGSLAGNFRIRISEFIGALPERRNCKFEEFVSHVA